MVLTNGDIIFSKVKINNDYLYIDKTKYIETLENLNESFVLFLRPRRFGKSLFLSTLQYYYDENSKNDFEALFHDTYIGKNPTPLKSSFRILFFEFSGIEVENRTISEIKSSFVDNVKVSLARYLDNYGYDKETVGQIRKLDEPSDILKEFFEIIKNDEIYLLIDEYDQWLTTSSQSMTINDAKLR